ncbi:DNA-directed RNA polymerase III complex subunit Rpc25 [Neophaeococcomyces mojaviensis]|uniref:DNA-directed RNA polymerase III complex subunit Rpc25 n=1 Tax=Neophaeococcomyces mojaviensis TaxID=3383035 RepID=A0ACC3AF42_9EURO|nr:DNA-directed RNA polymerase III complex subunit Rpc25 [Knufia sp. JES_112]
MFILTKFQDLVQIPPHEFYKKSRDCIEDKINEKYANKVVQKVGLCICMWDLLKASDGLIGFGTGNVNVNVEFRMVVFRPFKGEVIAARVKHNTPEGIYLTTEFFDNIFVPETMLFEGSFFNTDEKVWVWKTGETEIFFDDGIPVYARIEKETWEDAMQNTSKPSKTANGVSSPSQKTPYSIEASMQEHGLGGIDWW